MRILDPTDPASTSLNDRPAAFSLIVLVIFNVSILVLGFRLPVFETIYVENHYDLLLPLYRL